MATETVPNDTRALRTLSAEMSQARDRAIFQAAREVSAIASMLRRETADLADFADSEFLLPGSLMRVEALGNALATLSVSAREAENEISDQYAVVFGKPLEVSHG